MFSNAFHYLVMAVLLQILAEIHASHSPNELYSTNYIQEQTQHLNSATTMKHMFT